MQCMLTRVLAAGTFWQGKWTYTVLECDMRAATRLHINYKEICAVVRVVEDWAHSWHGKTVIVHTDSTVTKSVINKGWSKCICEPLIVKTGMVMC